MQFMRIITQFELSPEDLKAILLEVLAPVEERLRGLEIVAGTRKHAYTVAETAVQIGYSKQMVFQFIKSGRIDSKGRKNYLKHHEITRGDYRITPADLDEFLSHF